MIEHLEYNYAQLIFIESNRFIFEIIRWTKLNEYRGADSESLWMHVGRYLVACAMLDQESIQRYYAC